MTQAATGRVSGYKAKMALHFFKSDKTYISQEVFCVLQPIHLRQQHCQGSKHFWNLCSVSTLSPYRIFSDAPE